MSIALILTVVLSMALGIGSGYVIIVGILAAFDRNRRERTPARALVPSAGTTGD
jgi:hypothetical protein